MKRWPRRRLLVPTTVGLVAPAGSPSGFAGLAAASGVVTVDPGGGVNVNSDGSCAPNVRSLNPTCRAGSGRR